MNNRQSGRRRGRNNNSNNNNNRSQSGGGRGGVDQANRIDSRARGNGAQMIEKYRNLARDAQLAGDRVQTEYYLQFADHYFRVVSDFRARQEEKAAANGQERSHDRGREIRGVEDFDGHDDSGFDSDGDGDNDGDRNDSGRDRSEGNRDRNGRGARDRRDDDDNRGNRQQRERGNRRDRDDDRGNAVDADQNDADETVEEAAPAPRAARRGPRRPRDAETLIPDAGDAGIDSAVLPPAIGRTEPVAEAVADEAPAPKARRTRRTLAPRDAGAEAAE